MNKKGITLTTMVVTIIVIIILTGAVIVTLSGANIIGKASKAAMINDLSQIRDEVEVALNRLDINETANEKDSYKLSELDIINEDLEDYIRVDGGYIYVLYDSPENLKAAAIELGINITRDGSVQGLNEIALNNVSVDRLINYRIYGDSVQASGATPSNLIDVTSLGETSKNIFDKETVKLVSGYNTDFILRAGVQYTISYKSTGTQVYSTMLYIGSDIWSTRVNAGEIKEVKYTITPSTDTPLGLYYNGIPSSGQFKNFFNQDTTEFQVEVGPTATEYRPYKCIEIKTGGKNLFNEENYKTMSQYNTLYATSPYTYAIILLKPNTTYKVSVKRYNGFDGKNNGYLLLSDHNAINGVTWSSITHLTSPDHSEVDYKYTTGSNGKLFIGYYKSNMTQEKLDYIWQNTDVQIEEGSNATAYEPYQDPKLTTIDLTGHEPLRKVGDAADYLDYGKGKIIRKTKKYTFTGSENWQLEGTGDTTCKFSAEGVLETYAGNKCLSNMGSFPNGTNDSVSGNKGVGLYADNDNNSEKIYIETDKTQISTTTQLTQYLQSNDVYVIYEMVEQKEENIDLPPISLFKGKSTLNLIAASPNNISITGARMELEYN